MKQREVEEYGAKLGLERERAKNERAIQKGTETNTTAGRRLLREAIEAVILGVEEALHRYGTQRGPKIQAWKILKQLPPEVSSLLICTVIVDKMSRPTNANPMCFAIGRFLEDEIRYNLLAESDKGLWDYLNRTRKKSYRHFRERVVREMEKCGADFTPLSRADLIQVGAFCLELFVARTGLVKVVRQRLGKKKTVNVVVPTEETVEWLEEARKANEDLFPVFLPTTIPPVPWEGMWGGGYHTNVIVQTPFITPQKHSGTKLSEYDVPEYHMKSVNIMQNTAWKINQPVLDVMQHFWNNNIPIGCLPDRELLPLPEKPHDISTNPESVKKYRRACAEAHKYNNARLSSRLLTSKHLFLGEKYRSLRFFMPWFCDYRGRAYPRPHGLQPQGQQQARGLLTFADGKPITRLDQEAALARHGANCYGVDKVSFDERVEWVEKHEKEILQSAKDPKGYTWWATFDKPWEGLAFCFEWAAFKEQGYGYVSSLPVSVDASNSGHQVYSLLLRDKPGAISTNVYPDSHPHDLYQDVADTVTKELEQEAAEGSETAKRWLQFVGGRLPRKATKRITMVIVYSAKLYSALEYTAEWYREHKEKIGSSPFEGEAYKECAYLAKKIWKAVEGTVDGAKSGMKWLMSVADICSKENLPVRWTSPSGFPVIQRCSKTARRRIFTRAGSNLIRSIDERDPTDKISSKKQRLAICPNFVHSLDAAAVMTTVQNANMEGVESFSMVHDSYGTCAADMPVMEKILRDVFADQFSEDLLRTFKSEVENYLPQGVTLPEPPEYGELDPQVVRDSPYFFG